MSYDGLGSCWKSRSYKSVPHTCVCVHAHTYIQETVTMWGLNVLANLSVVIISQCMRIRSSRHMRQTYAVLMSMISQSCKSLVKGIKDYVSYVSASFTKNFSGRPVVAWGLVKPKEVLPNKVERGSTAPEVTGEIRALWPRVCVRRGRRQPLWLGTHKSQGPGVGSPGLRATLQRLEAVVLTFAISSFNLHERLHFLAKEADVLTV